VIFAEFPLAEAHGIVLAHTEHLADGKLRKGRTLDAGDVERLRGAGYTHVLGARLEDGDTVEDDAAGALATALCGNGVQHKPPGAGRCNLVADHAGVVTVVRTAVDALNAIDEAAMLATLPPNSPVRAGQVVATCKIVPLALPGHIIKAWKAGIKMHGTPLAVAPYRHERVVLLQSEAGHVPASLHDKTTRNVMVRLATIGHSLHREVRCAHEVAAIAAALPDVVEQGCDLLLVAGGNATVDRNDTVPAALRLAGGTLTRLGIPFEPGSLLTLGRLGDMPVVILPGCARSPVLNGFDRVLGPLLADLPFTPSDIAALGCGGLLKGGTDAS